MLALKYGLSESLSGYGSGKADQVVLSLFFKISVCKIILITYFEYSYFTITNAEFCTTVTHQVPNLSLFIMWCRG